MSLPTAFGSRSPDAESRLRRLADARVADRRDAIARPAALSASRRARRCRRRSATACSVICAVAGDSVGAVAVGIWMVREAWSKP